jgi:hypothetical protein
VKLNVVYLSSFAYPFLSVVIALIQVKSWWFKIKYVSYNVVKYPPEVLAMGGAAGEPKPIGQLAESQDVTRPPPPRARQTVSLVDTHPFSRAYTNAKYDRKPTTTTSLRYSTYQIQQPYNTHFRSSPFSAEKQPRMTGRSHPPASSHRMNQYSRPTSLKKKNFKKKLKKKLSKQQTPPSPVALPPSPASPPKSYITLATTSSTR